LSSLTARARARARATYQYAAEDEGEREHQVGNVTSRLGRLVESDDHVGERRGEHEEDPDEEEKQRAPLVNSVRRLGVAV
jgi:hypothetical protein